MQAVFKKKPHRFDHVIKMGENKLQDAIPIRLGQEFETHRLVVERNFKILPQLKAEYSRRYPDNMVSYK